MCSKIFLAVVKSVNFWQLLQNAFVVEGGVKFANKSVFLEVRLPSLKHKKALIPKRDVDFNKAHVCVTKGLKTNFESKVVESAQVKEHELQAKYKEPEIMPNICDESKPENWKKSQSLEFIDKASD
jgi:hypothetical protein